MIAKRSFDTPCSLHGQEKEPVMLLVTQALMPKITWDFLAIMAGQVDGSVDGWQLENREFIFVFYNSEISFLHLDFHLSK